MILRELFSKIVVDVKSAIANVNRFDAAMDGASEGLADTEKQAEGIGDTLNKATKKVSEFGSRLADAFKRGGRAAFAARGKIKDAGVGIGKAFAAASAGAGAATLAAGALTIAWADNAQELDNLSKRYQISTDELQGVTGALNLMGLEAEDGLETIKELRLRLGEAEKEGASPLREGLKQLGINFEQFKDLPIIDQLGVVADRWNELESQQKKNSIANDIAGEDLIKLFPLLEKGSDGILKLTRRSKELNLVQSKDSIKAGAALSKSWKTLLAIFNSVRNIVASQLEPTFTAMIATVLDWVQANRKLITGKVVDFVERLVNVTADFIPVAAEFADAMLGIIESLGGVEGAITAIVGTMATWKLATASLLGPAGPWIAGLVAVTAALKIFGARVDAEDKKIQRLATRRAQGLDFRRRRTFSTEELQEAGAPGAEVLRLEQERAGLVAQREGLGIGNDFEAARQANRAANEARLTSAGRDRFAQLEKLDKQFEGQIDAAKRLEESIEKLAEGIDEQIGLINDERQAKSNDQARERAIVSTQAIADEKSKRAESRRLLDLFALGKLDNDGKEQLRELLFELGLDQPEGLTSDGKTTGTRKPKDDDKELSVEELVGLGPEGVKTLSDLVPTGQGTTINNFAFITTVQPARVDITVNSPEGTSAVEVAQETSERFGRVQSDMITADQRELVGQLQG